MPAHLHHDARVPFLGFAGASYRSGGLVLLAINPGGGREAYVRRTTQDEELIPLIEAFVTAEPSARDSAFRSMSSVYSLQAQSWNLRRILMPTIEACGRHIDEICYLNCFPYRTARDALPAVTAVNESWRQVVAPLLDALAPRQIIALGKKAGNVAASRYVGAAAFAVVPRTIGDTRISQEAQVVLNYLRQSGA